MQATFHESRPAARRRHSWFGQTTLFLMLLVIAGCQAVLPRPMSERDVLPDPVRLTHGFAEAGDAVFSPDMEWIAFRATPRGEATAQLYLARVRFDGDGEDRTVTGIGEPIRVTPRASRNATPVFSPDGNTLVFTSTADAVEDPLRDEAQAALNFDALADLFRVDGWQRNIAAADPRRGVNFAKYPIAPHAGFDGEATFTPDGQWLIFATDRGAPRTARDTHALIDLYAMRPDGTDLVRLTNQHGFDGYPSVSADGNMLAFQSDREEAGRYDLYIGRLERSADGTISGLTGVRPMDKGRNARHPTFHPSQNYLLFVSGREDARSMGNREIHQMRPDGTRKMQLTFDPAPDESPRLSADGTHLLFSSRRTPDGSRQVFVSRYLQPRRSAQPR